MLQQLLGKASEGRRLPDQDPVRVWASLRHGDCVDVWSGGSFRYTAFVDDRADDGRFIWVIEKGAGCRRLFVRDDDPVSLYLI